MKRLDARVADLEAKHIPLQRVVRVLRHERKSQDEAITAAGFDPSDDEIFFFTRSVVSPQSGPDRDSS
ncbi:hypothetical protein [Sphingomonas sp.]|uniref:hypothetical protein n=1 Tax=Sphingomonas sp. TaxID=28214 RepID=UPI0017A09DAB|nr:hypothetical protein [Sphingomonas sp.]MBA3512613.1 hypothetical protein [Sphingomonas sp.]